MVNWVAKRVTKRDRTIGWAVRRVTLLGGKDIVNWMPRLATNGG